MKVQPLAQDCHDELRVLCFVFDRACARIVCVVGHSMLSVPANCSIHTDAAKSLLYPAGLRVMPDSVQAT